jgi:hypothetical protein
MPERVETLGPLSLIVAITLGPREGSSSGLKDFVVPPEGAIVTVIVSSPGLVANGDMQLSLDPWNSLRGDRRVNSENAF